MERREFITAVSGGLIGLAGCTSGSSGAVEDSIETADEHLGQAGDEFTSESDKFGNATEGVDFRTSVIFTQLDEADSALEEASNEDDGEYTSLIQALQNTSDFLRSTTQSLDHFATALNSLQQATDYSDTERYGDSISTLQEANSALSEVQSDTAVAQSELEEIDTDQLGEADEVDIVEIRDAFTQLTEARKAMEYFVNGYMDLNRAFRAFSKATDQFEAERYSQAATSFDNARAHSTSAETTFREGESVDSPDLTSSFIDLSCTAKAFKESSGHYNNASEAAASGYYNEANEQAEEAQNALDQCE
jgi:uncharacterized phage infection (PIP) family protein YhgE